MANLETLVEKEVSLENDENYKKLLEEIKEAINNSPLKDALMQEDYSFLDEFDEEEESSSGS